MIGDEVSFSLKAYLLGTSLEEILPKWKDIFNYRQKLFGILASR